MRTFDRGPLKATAVALVALCALAGTARADDPAPDGAKFRFGGAGALALPTGEFADQIDVAGGLSGFALYGRPRSAFALRADASFLLYGTRTLQRPVLGTDGQVLEDVATTDNWIGQLALGPQVMAHSGRVRPYANAFAGMSYFATTSQLVFPRPVTVLVVPGAPLVPVGQDAFRTTTHHDDVIASYGGGAGVLVGLGHGGTALDLGVRYVGGGTVRYLVEGDPTNGPARRSEGHLVEFRIGVVGLH
jgi:hypothetical protein